MKFYSTIRMEVVRIATLKKDKGEPFGITIKVTIRKNKIAPPFREAQFDILFAEDSGVVDYVGATLDYLKDNGFIGGSSGWYELDGKNYRPEDAKNLLKENDNLMLKKYQDMIYEEHM